MTNELMTNEPTPKNLTRNRKQELALELYLNTDKTQREICDVVGWTEKTFTAHKERGDWQSLKGATSITAARIIKKLYIKLDKLADDDAVNADALIKVANSIEKLSDKKLTLSHHINCAKEFTVWLLRQNPQLAQQLNKYQQQFINQLVSNG